MHDLSYSSKFHQEILQAVEQKLKAALDLDPDNLKLLKRLAEIYRQQGQLGQGYKIYQKILNLDKKDPVALHWEHILNFELKRSWPSGMEKNNGTALFIQRSLLGQSHVKSLLKFVEENINSFDDMGFFMKDANEVIDNSVRQTKGLRNCDDVGRYVLAWIKNNYHDLCSFFNIPESALNLATTEITIYSDGGFGLAHKDSSSNSLSFLYYFYRKPKKFTGGDLYIYDGDLTKKSSQHTYTKVNVESDMLLIFPSHHYHEITPVHCPDHGLMDGRMAFVGHVRK